MKHDRRITLTEPSVIDQILAQQHFRSREAHAAVPLRAGPALVTGPDPKPNGWRGTPARCRARCHTRTEGERSIPDAGPTG